jgi:hypothetical protein
MEPCYNRIREQKITQLDMAVSLKETSLIKTIQRYFRVDRKAICLLRFTFEGYEGIANVTTLTSATGLIVFNIAPGCESDVENVLQDLQKHVYMEAILPED